jgi:hypothetical protein
VCPARPRICVRERHRHTLPEEIRQRATAGPLGIAILREREVQRPQQIETVQVESRVHRGAVGNGRPDRARVRDDRDPERC